MGFKKAQSRQTEAANDLAKKIKLESKLKRSMNTLFRKIAKDMREQFIESGTIIKSEIFRPEIRNLLKDQYSRTFKAFNNTIIDQSKSTNYGLVVKQVEESIVNRSNERFLEQQSLIQSQKITDTNQKEINAAILASILSFEEIGEEFTRQDVAREASTAFLRRSESRSVATSITETQNPAETSKLNQMNALILTGVISGSAAKKIWTAILDTRVRDFHAVADGQERSMGEPFEVNSELLNHPGDTSLGASANNVINCRCSSSLQI